jgi:hypothetical protein
MKAALRAIHLVLIALAVIAAPASVYAQSAILQGGAVTPGHVPMYINGYSQQPIATDSGPAAGGPPGTGLSELGLTLRGNGTPPFANAGTGNLGTNVCDYDAPTTNATGYHSLCFSPNAQGGGLIAYNAFGGATALPLTFEVNGLDFTLPGSTSCVGCLNSASITTTATLAPLTPIFEYNYPISADPHHYSDFAIQQTNSGSHTTYDNSAFSVSSAVVGAGDNLPAHYDNGLTVSALKQNWPTSAIQGGINVLNIIGRQGTDDIDGITEDVGVVAGYAAGVEGHTESLTSGSEAIIQQMDYQLGEIETGATGAVSANGLNLQALAGTLVDGLAIYSLAGSGWTDAIVVNANGNGGTTFSVTPAGLVSATNETIGGTATSGTALSISQTNNAGGATIALTGNGNTTPNKFLNVQGGQFEIINSADTSAILSLDDVGDMQAFGHFTATGYTAGTSAGVSCNGTPTSSFAAVSGIVTHC